MSLNLDIDVVRGLLGGWTEDPATSGLLARSAAIAMASAHLSGGRDVIVPQFLGRPGFIDELRNVASRVDARFIEVALWLGRSEAIAAFTERRAAPTTQAHLDAVKLVEQSARPDPVGAMYDEFLVVMEERPYVVRVDVIRGDIDKTYQNLLEAVA